jgi:hypothetical protein
MFGLFIPPPPTPKNWALKVIPNGKISLNLVTLLMAIFHPRNLTAKNLRAIWASQGTLTEGEGSVQLASSLRYLVLKKKKINKNFK